MEFKIDLILIPVLAVLALSSCSVPQKVVHCENVDWFDRGRRDGLLGSKKEELKHPNPSCQNLKPDQLAYNLGVQSGLNQYCDPKNALNLGRSGLPVSPVCPSPLKASFDENYEKGRKIYELEKQNEDINDEMTQLYRSLRDPKISPTQKSEVSDNLKRLEAQQNQVKAKINVIERLIF